MTFVLNGDSINISLGSCTHTIVLDSVERFISVNIDTITLFALGQTDDCVLDMHTTTGYVAFGYISKRFFINMHVNNIGTFHTDVEILTDGIYQAFRRFIAKLVQIEKKL